MKKFPAKSRRNPRLVLTVTLVILSLLIIASSTFNVVRYALGRFTDSFFYPYLKISTPDKKLSDTSLLLADKHTLAAKVEELGELNRELALQGNAAKDLLEENRKLRSLLSLNGKTAPRYVTAGIILRDPLHFKESFTIDKGSRDGIVKGAAVIDVNEQGNLMLVGVVYQTSARSSKIITVMNPALRISGIIPVNKAVGFTNAGKVKPGKDRISFGMLPERDDYIPQMVVNTTGFENGIPAGIRIGELYTASLSHSQEQEDVSCELIPAVQFESLRFVSVALIPAAAAPEELK